MPRASPGTAITSVYHGIPLHLLFDLVVARAAGLPSLHRSTVARAEAVARPFVVSCCDRRLHSAGLTTIESWYQSLDLGQTGM